MLSFDRFVNLHKRLASSMPETSYREPEVSENSTPETERVRRIQLMQMRVKARRRSTEIRNATAQSVERMRRSMVGGIVIAAVCTAVTSAAVLYRILLKF
jgi:hypothetical protein